MVALVEPQKGIGNEVQGWGSSLSELLLDSSFEEFRLNRVPGFIGYREIPGFAIVIGDPVTPPEYQETLASGFFEYAKERKLQLIYFGVSRDFTDKCPVKIQMGEELIFDPYNDPLEGPKGSRLRNKIQFAKKNGLSVKEFIYGDVRTEKALRKVVNEWVTARKGPQLYFGDIEFFNFYDSSRCFYVKNGEQYYGAALLKAIDAKEGWLLKHHIARHDAPRGTTEMLLVGILETLRKEKCHYLTYGVVPPKSITNIQGLGKVSSWGITQIYAFIRWFFGLRTRMAFWEKFQPSMKPAYILFSSGRFSLGHLRALMKILKMKL